MLKRYFEIDRQFMVSNDWLEGERGVQEMDERVSNQENKEQAWEQLKQLEQVYEAVRCVGTCAYTAGDLHNDLYNLIPHLQRVCNSMYSTTHYSTRQ